MNKISGYDAKLLSGQYSVGRLVGLDLMREYQVLSSHSIYGFDINVLFWKIIKLKLNSLNYNVKNKEI